MTTKQAKEGTLYRATMPAKYLAADDAAEPGSFRALVSAYDVRYYISFMTYHTIKMGAFAESIAEQAALPIFWMHSWAWSELPPIGDGTGEEDPASNGLIIDGDFYISESENARVINRACVAGAIREWSIGYSVIESTTDPEDPLHEIVTKAELLEASSVLRGANPDTETLEVAKKNDGRTVITYKGMQIETNDQDLIKELLAQADPEKLIVDDPEEVNDISSLSWATQRKIHHVFGDALAASE